MSQKRRRRSVESIFFSAAQVKVRTPDNIQILNLNNINVSTALIGTVEELSASQQTLNLVRDQFEVNYFGPLNIIKAALPHMRREQSGHIMIISGISTSIDS